MLHKSPQIISPETFSLIQQLQQLPELKDFFLVGGTALALQLGHRNSIDIDLFSQKDFDSGFILSFLKNKYKVEERYVEKNTLIIFVQSIKVDLLTHNYHFVKPPLSEEGIHFLSKEDIAAMKLNAIAHSGKRLKDFIDVYFLLQHFSLNSMIEFYKVKYSFSNPLIPIKAINFFDDIDENADPPKLMSPLPFEKIKKRIMDATLHPHKVF